MERSGGTDRHDGSRLTHRVLLYGEVFRAVCSGESHVDPYGECTGDLDVALELAREAAALTEDADAGRIVVGANHRAMESGVADSADTLTLSALAVDPLRSRVAGTHHGSVIIGVADATDAFPMSALAINTLCSRVAGTYHGSVIIGVADATDAFPMSALAVDPLRARVAGTYYGSMNIGMADAADPFPMNALAVDTRARAVGWVVINANYAGMKDSMTYASNTLEKGAFPNHTNL